MDKHCKNRIELDMTAKAMELIRLYKRYNPNGNYLSIAFVQTDDDKIRIHINNAYYDKDHGHPINIVEDMTL